MLGKKKDKVKDGPETKDWYRDKHQYVLVQRNILALVTLVALGVALLSVFTIMQLTPKKTVEPFVVKIDEKTGMVQQVRQGTKQEFTANELVDNYFVVKYIRFLCYICLFAFHIYLFSFCFLRVSRYLNSS